MPCSSTPPALWPGSCLAPCAIHSSCMPHLGAASSPARPRTSSHSLHSSGTSFSNVTGRKVDRQRLRNRRLGGVVSVRRGVYGQIRDFGVVKELFLPIRRPIRKEERQDRGGFFFFNDAAPPEISPLPLPALFPC